MTEDAIATIPYTEFTKTYAADPAFPYDTMAYAGKLMLLDSHPAVCKFTAARASAAFISGQTFLKPLAEKTIFSVEDLAAEFGGAMPIEMDDPRKAGLTLTAAVAVDQLSSTCDAWYAGLIAHLDERLAAAICDPEGPFPELQVADESKAFDRLKMLYIPKGGMFTAFTGVLFYFRDGSSRILYLPDLADNTHCATAVDLVQRLMRFRNHLTDGYTQDYLHMVVTEVLTHLPPEFHVPDTTAATVEPVDHIEDDED